MVTYRIIWAHIIHWTALFGDRPTSSGSWRSPSSPEVQLDLLPDLKTLLTVLMSSHDSSPRFSTLHLHPALCHLNSLPSAAKYSSTLSQTCRHSKNRCFCETLGLFKSLKTLHLCSICRPAHILDKGEIIPQKYSVIINNKNRSFSLS